MGLDWIQKRPFRKTWNRSVDLLSRADLLSAVPRWLHRRALATCVDDGTGSFEAGEELVALVGSEGEIVICRNTAIVAVVTDAAPDVSEAIEASSASAALAKVEAVNTLSNTIELTIEIPPRLGDK